MVSEEIVVTYVSWVWALSEIIGAYIIPHFRQKGKTKARRDKCSLTIIWFTIVVSIAIAEFFGRNGITVLPEWFFYVGIALMLAGIAFRQWAIWVLGRFFSIRVRIVSDHRIIREGPYSAIRHPSYTGMLIILLGLGLASRTWAGTIIMFALIGPVIYYRIIVEENALKTEFGTEYVEYAKKTKRLIPYLL